MVVITPCSNRSSVISESSLETAKAINQFQWLIEGTGMKRISARECLARLSLMGTLSLEMTIADLRLVFVMMFALATGKSN
jgi:hypothetical protein